MQTAKFCIYCFWKPQKQFDSVKGVLKTEVGYIGGNKENITYEECCTKETNACEAIIGAVFVDRGYSYEAIIVEFDEKIISYKEIVTHFFNFHTLDQLDGIDPNVGSNYRSHIYTVGNEQKKIAEEVRDEINKKLKKEVVTKITSDTGILFSRAEEFHQQYYLKKSR